MLRHFAFVSALLLFAGVLSADRISYIVGTGANAKVEFADDAKLTAWSAAKVTFEAAGRKIDVDYANIISIDRRGSSMSRTLENILDGSGADPVGAAAQLGTFAAATDSTDFDKQEATIYRAQILESESVADKALTAQAIAAYKDYTGKWKAGFFAREAYRGLAGMQNANDARATLRGMVGADKALEREGNQWLGELEMSEAKWADAIAAFKKAASAAGTDQNNKYLAMAWEGWATLRNNNAAGARTLLETITEDAKFDDPNTTVDENALAIAFRALGDLHYEAGSHKKAYEALIKGAYYAWWTGGNFEGHCLGYAFVCAKKLEGGTDADWKNRKEKLQTALAVGFPRVLSEMEKMK